jgi:CHAT domain-containing protein
LIVGDGGTVQVVPLADGLMAAAEEWTERLAAATSRLESDAAGAREVLWDLLDWLYRAVCGPVLEALAASGPEPGGGERRVWWCPTGPLSSLPLHAAGLRDDAGSSVLAKVVSSYTPTLRILDRAWRSGEAGAGVAGAGLAVIPQRADLHALPTADRFVGDPRFRTVLAGAAATGEAFLAALDHHDWLYFGGHGSRDAESPADGWLELADGRVTVREIAGRRLAAPSLAVLTACETARGGRVLADEAMTLASAMQVAGFRHVAGTLWPVRDTVAGRFAGRFLGRAGDTADVAGALHDAVVGLRERFGSDPFSWAGFVHYGP